MTPQLPPGTPLTLTRIADHAPLPEGRVATTHTIFAPRGSAGARVPGPSVLAVGQLGGRRVVAEAEFFVSQGEHDVFRLCGDWRWVDTRRHPRFDTRLPATVRTRMGIERLAGTLLNLSAGGAAVHLPQAPETSDCELVLAAFGLQEPFPVRVVNARNIGRGLIIHLEFEPLTAGADRFLHALLDELRRGTHLGQTA